MTDYISREAALDAICSDCPLKSVCPHDKEEVTFCRARKKLRAIPAADVKPVVRGKWGDNGLPGSMLYGCSECGFTCGAYSFNYCPNCGATMKEAEK